MKAFVPLVVAGLVFGSWGCGPPGTPKADATSGPPAPTAPPSPPAPAAATAGALPAGGERREDSRESIVFTDATARAGIRFFHMTGASGRRFYVEPHSGGCAALDYDGDGWVDIYAVDGGPLPGYRGERRRGNRLFRNRGDGTFEDVTTRANVAGTGYGEGVAAGDYDGDGDPDLFVAQFQAPDLLYRNEGNGTFTEVGRQAGIAHTGWSTSAVFFDADLDGDLDLYVVRYLDYTTARNRECWHSGQRYHCSPYDYPYAPDSFYRNLGNGVFQEVSREVGMVDPDGKGLGVISGDFNEDGWPDIYVSNDETPNLLFLNRGGGRFEEAGFLAGVAVNASGAVQAGMGIDVGDFDGDGHDDIIVTNFQDEANNLYRNLGGGFFLDEAYPRGFGLPGEHLLGFAAHFLDADQDGDLDVFIANGHVWDNAALIRPGSTYAQPKLLLRNDGGRFTDVTSRAGAALLRPEVSRGACIADYDGDGDLDIYYVNLDAEGVFLRNDQETGNHWVLVKLVGTRCNREALGARVSVSAGGRVQSREVRRTSGIFSSSDVGVHFGLGRATRIDRLTVRWPGSARETVLADPGIDRVVTVVQP